MAISIRRRMDPPAWLNALGPEGRSRLAGLRPHLPRILARRMAMVAALHVD